jgi:hypothetical protein
VLRAASEAPNGDGRAFEAEDGARMIVYGTNNVEDASLPSFADPLARPDERITYRAGRGGWIVRSGTRRDKVFWRKTFVSGDQFVTLAIDYPAARRRTYGPIVAPLSKCFAIGKPAS